jgi:antiviral helicase SKI2
VQNEKELRALPQLDNSPRIQTMRKFYDISSRLVELNSRLIDRALRHSSSSKIFAGGRIIMLTDGVSGSIRLSFFLANVKYL